MFNFLMPDFQEERKLNLMQLWLFQYQTSSNGKQSEKFFIPRNRKNGAMS